jgi:hypothetical protein
LGQDRWGPLATAARGGIHRLVGGAGSWRGSSAFFVLEKPRKIEKLAAARRTVENFFDQR